MRRAAGRSAMVEVNVSCPNTHVGEPFTATPEALDRLFTELDKIERPQPTLVKMPLNKPWGQYKELLDVLAEHNVQGLTIANLQKDRTGLEIPRDWEGGLSGGPCTDASEERFARSIVNMASVSPSPASAACSPRSRHIARFATAPAWSCSSAH